MLLGYCPACLIFKSISPLKLRASLNDKKNETTIKICLTRSAETQYHETHRNSQNKTAQTSVRRKILSQRTYSTPFFTSNLFLSRNLACSNDINIRSSRFKTVKCIKLVSSNSVGWSLKSAFFFFLKKGNIKEKKKIHPDFR